MGAFLVMGICAVVMVGAGVLLWWNNRRVGRLKASGDFVPMGMTARTVLVCFAALLLLGGFLLLQH